MTRQKVEFIQPKPRIEDWRVILDGRTAGSVWRCRDHYIANVTNQARLATLDDAFKEARRQARGVAVPETKRAARRRG